uniref:Uncharacterized protein n=1 Tax=Cucumis melo TaxID=3656 RepID=A0A9I9E5E0_CUCME
SVLFSIELKTKEKGRREKRRFLVVCSSPPSVPSSLSSLVISPSSATLALWHRQHTMKIY